MKSSTAVSAAILSLLLSTSLLAGSGCAYSRPLSYDRYDDAIQKSVRTYWPDFPDWKYWKAQLYQESRLDPDATSPVGAEGLAQFMPGTWADVQRRLGWSGLSPRAARPAIDAGAYYMTTLRHAWSSPRPELDRHELAQASYNGGLGNILKAQKICSNARHWPGIRVCLSLVTGQHAQETLGYVDRIRHWRGELGP